MNDFSLCGLFFNLCIYWYFFSLNVKAFIYYFCFIFFLQNELAILEFIHNLVETLDRYFSSVVSMIAFYLLLFNSFTVLPYIKDMRTCKKRSPKN